MPPHEREWRHPSELPAPPHEPPTPGGRLLIVATAAIGLALVGVMAMRMTPGRTASRDALITVSTSAVFQTVSADSFGELAGAASNGGRRFTDLLGRTLSSFFASPDRSQVSASTIARPAGATSGVGGTAFAVVTPIGSEGLGVTTAAAVEGQVGKIEAMLPSGAIITAELIDTHDGIAVVELPEAEVVAATRLAAADHPDDLTVVAFGDEFSVHADGADLQSLAVPEAAPIFAADGTLVGLCTVGPDGVEMLRVGSLPDIAVPPATDTTEPTERPRRPSDRVDRGYEGCREHGGSRQRPRHDQRSGESADDGNGDAIGEQRRDVDRVGRADERSARRLGSSDDGRPLRRAARRADPDSRPRSGGGASTI